MPAIRISGPALSKGGSQGVRGLKGDKPAYEIDGLRIRWEQPDGSPGDWIDLDDVVGFNFRGDWDAAIGYEANDLVNFGESVYNARRDNTNAMPDQSPDDWRLFVRGGTVGDGAVTRPKLSSTAYSTDPETKSGTLATGAINPLRLLSRLKYDGYLAVRHFGVKLDGTNESTALDAALAEAVPLKFPKGLFPIFQPLVVRGAGGIIGSGEGTRLQRQFIGGAMVRVPAGTEPVTLRDFDIGKHPDQQIALGDTGISLGENGSWAGRGDIRNLRIFNQWDGFKWEGGGSLPVDYVTVTECEGHGFYGVNPRGEFQRCLSTFNKGSGFYIYAKTSGETGVRLTDCGTFCNQEFGLDADTAPGIVGANLWLESRFSASFDGRGGIHLGKPLIQFHAESPFIEFIGYARQFRPDFIDYPGAKGLTIAGGGAQMEKIALNNAEIINNRAQGVLIDAADVVFSGVTKIVGNGQGNGSGADRVGLGIQNNARVQIQGLYTEAHKGSTTQSTDIAVNTGNCVVTVGETDARTVFDAGSPLRFVGDRPNLQNASVTAASTLPVLDQHRRLTVSGTTAIDAIAATWAGHDVILHFLAATPIGSGNNIRGGGFTTTAGQALRAFYDGTNWLISR